MSQFTNLKKIIPKGFIIQSIIFPKKYINLEDAIDILHYFGYKYYVDVKKNTYRFRQIDPIYPAIYRTMQILLLPKNMKNNILIDVVIMKKSNN